MAGSSAVPPGVLVALAALSGCTGPGLRSHDATGLAELRLLARAGEVPADSRPTPVDPAAPPVSAADLLRFGDDDMRANELVAQAFMDGGRRGLEALPAGDTPVQRLARAKALLRLNQPQEALLFFEALLRETPDYLPASAGLGHARFLQGKHDEAIQILTRIQRLWPANLDARLVLAQALHAAQRDDEAVEHLRTLVPTGPLAAPAASLLGRILWERRMYREGLDVMAATLKAVPTATEVRYLYGLALEERGQFAAARTELAQVLEDRMPPLQARVRLVHVLRALGDFAGAAQQCQMLRAAVADNPASPLRAEAERLAAVVAEEQRTGERQDFSLPELRGILAANPDRTRRMAALQALGRADLRLVANDLRGVLQDEDPLLRRVALRLLAGRSPDPDLVARGLGDADPGVRTEAMGLALQLPDAAALPLLLGTLQREADPVAFRAGHEALEKKSGQRVFLATGAERDPAQRAAAAAEWRSRLK